MYKLVRYSTDTARDGSCSSVPYYTPFPSFYWDHAKSIISFYSVWVYWVELAVRLCQLHAWLLFHIGLIGAVALRLALLWLAQALVA